MLCTTVGGVKLTTLTVHKNIKTFLQSFIPLTAIGQLARWSYVLDKVNALEVKVQPFTDGELRKESL